MGRVFRIDSFHLRFGEWHSPVAMYGAKVRRERGLKTETFSGRWNGIPRLYAWCLKNKKASDRSRMPV
jgi:hypothetical protein